jgi:large conductance mechanosensitive channel
MKKLLNEFKTFAMRGNVMDMAVGIIIGAAFGKIVNSLVQDVLMPPIGMLMGQMDFSQLSIVLKEASTDVAGNAIPAVTINYGLFINTIIQFLIVAAAVFMLIKAVNTAVRKQAETPAPPPPAVPTKEELLLTEIRDILKSGSSRS